MKWLKRLLILLVAVLILLFVSVAVVPGRLARGLIEKSGTLALGVETTLESAKVSPFTGSFGLEGFAIANPAGFAAEHFLTLRTGALDVAMGSLLSDEVKATGFELSGVSLVLERSVEKTNYGVILENLKRFESGEKDDGGKEKSFFIEEIVIRDVEVSAGLSLMEGAGVQSGIRLPEVVLRDVGGGEGFTTARLISTIVEAILEAVSEHGLEGLSKEILADLDAGLRELGTDAEAAVGKVLKKKGEEALRGILGGKKMD